MSLTKVESDKLIKVLQTMDFKKKRKEEPSTYEVEAEIFALGLWNGMEFINEDLMQIANAFHTLKENHSVPLKMGHNEDQPFTDGQPALGWVEDVFIQDGKLKAKFVDVPEVVANAINNGLYKKVSIELDMGVEHMGQQFPLVLSGVALLGADIPAVNTLEDLSVLMKGDVTIRGTSRQTFTAVSKENTDMNDAEVAKLKAEKEALEKRLKDEAEKSVKFAADNAKLEAEAKVRDEQAAKDADTKVKVDFEAKLEGMVKAKTLTPALRESFMKSFDDKDIRGSVSRLEFTIEQIKDVKFDVHQEDEGLQNEDGTEDDGTKRPGEVLLSRVNEKMLENTTLDFQTAKRMVMKADTKLAREYIEENDGRAE